MNKNDLYFEILQVWGISCQSNMMMEECAELIQAISHWKRGRNIAKNVLEEMADVSILLEQMILAFGVEEFNKVKEEKFERLKNRFEEYKSKVMR